MREHLEFLQISSVAVKIAAWIFLFLGVLGGISITLGMVPGYPRWSGALILAAYAFLFFFFYIIAKMAELMVKIINEIKKD
jgi:hypothetical protein